MQKILLKHEKNGHNAVMELERILEEWHDLSKDEKQRREAALENIEAARAVIEKDEKKK